MGYIYCLTFPNGKRYIGQTKRTVEKRVSEHFKCIKNSLLTSALLKYNILNVHIETLLEINDVKLDHYEKMCIDMFNTIEPNGYNLQIGGVGGSNCSYISRKRMSDAKLGDKNHNFGKSRSDICKERISHAKSGEKHHFSGKALTYEHKLKLSIAHKSSDLPMYLVYIKPRPEIYQSEGYAVVNHPILKTKYFTSKHISLDDKYELALKYINSCDTNAVQRLNGDGCLVFESSA
jgi:group I intron endonuclease